MDVLLVDDSKVMLLRLRQFLEAKDGIIVTACSDPLAALVEAQTCAFDLVLIDQHMPELDGITFIREIRAIPHYAQVPVAMITSDVCDTVRLSALEAGATDFLDKRAKGVELNVRVGNLVRLAKAVRHLDEQATTLAGEIEQGGHGGRGSAALYPSRQWPPFRPGLCRGLRVSLGRGYGGP
ncbi:response regulator [Methylobacterium sp. E-041]|jgi:putative two-component system response regulator|uniref:response regulator n=1 Tax=unclassified Methylobacterium TaxID=2615210 RepID=UPI001FBB5AEC|nr:MULTISPECIES: response regulator [unclassified Methylobacterium]MCJ2105341.1 response regulator [Methylobacterium sp. E-041]MCJ2113308.1 response regulator [Methylobacterium sp. E-025]